MKFTTLLFASLVAAQNLYEQEYDASPMAEEYEAETPAFYQEDDREPFSYSEEAPAEGGDDAHAQKKKIFKLRLAKYIKKQHKKLKKVAKKFGKDSEKYTEKKELYAKNLAEYKKKMNAALVALGAAPEEEAAPAFEEEEEEQAYYNDDDIEA